MGGACRGCKNISFCEVTGILGEHLAVSLIDLTAVFAVFRQLDIDIVRKWDVTAYMQSAESDLSGWRDFRFSNKTAPI